MFTRISYKNTKAICLDSIARSI